LEYQDKQRKVEPPPPRLVKLNIQKPITKLPPISFLLNSPPPPQGTNGNAAIDNATWQCPGCQSSVRHRSSILKHQKTCPRYLEIRDVSSPKDQTTIQHPKPVRINYAYTQQDAASEKTPRRRSFMVNDFAASPSTEGTFAVNEVRPRIGTRYLGTETM
jgi:hypothetical protein